MTSRNFASASGIPFLLVINSAKRITRLSTFGIRSNGGLQILFRGGIISEQILDLRQRDQYWTASWTKRKSVFERRPSRCVVLHVEKRCAATS